MVAFSSEQGSLIYHRDSEQCGEHIWKAGWLHSEIQAGQKLLLPMRPRGRGRWWLWGHLHHHVSLAEWDPGNGGACVPRIYSISGLELNVKPTVVIKVTAKWDPLHPGLPLGLSWGHRPAPFLSCTHLQSRSYRLRFRERISENVLWGWQNKQGIVSVFYC